MAKFPKIRLPTLSFNLIPGIVEQSKLTPSFPEERLNRSERLSAYRRMRSAVDPEYKANLKEYFQRPEVQAKRKPYFANRYQKTLMKETVSEYQHLLGLDNPTVRQIRRLEALADYLGRDIEEWRNERMREEHADLMQGKFMPLPRTGSFGAAIRRRAKMITAKMVTPSREEIEQGKRNEARFYGPGGKLDLAAIKAEQKKLRTDKIGMYEDRNVEERDHDKAERAVLRPMEFNYRPATSQLTFRSGKTLEPILLRNQGEVAESIELEHDIRKTPFILGTRDYDIDVKPKEKKTYVPLGFMIRSAESPNKINRMELIYPNRALKQEIIYDLLKKRGPIEAQPIGTERKWWEGMGAERTEEPSAILMAMPHTDTTTYHESSERIPMRITRAGFEAAHLKNWTYGPYGGLHPEHLPAREKVPVEKVPKEYGWRAVDTSRIGYGAKHLIYSKEGMGSYQGTRLGKLSPGGSMITSKPKEIRRRYEEKMHSYVSPEEDIGATELESFHEHEYPEEEIIPLARPVAPDDRPPDLSDEDMRQYLADSHAETPELAEAANEEISTQIAKKEDRK